QIKTKRPEPCAIQDSDRWGRLIRFLSNFWGSYQDTLAVFCLQKVWVFMRADSNQRPVVLETGALPE
ncbi:MAG: hypothetical protein KH177_04395, partial [Faecalibacterium prausnitzii]|nr:hypothetical protein [Faecalibacterium prausnitzii]